MLDREKLLRRVESLGSELVELTQSLIRVDTTNPPGYKYKECQEIIGKRLGSCGFTVEYIRALGSPGDSESYPRYNLLCRRESGLGRGSVHFNGHVDVVAAGEGWQREPFGGEVEGDKLYGRGSADMKGGLASAVIALEALQREGVKTSLDLELSASADEESGGFGGMGYLAREGYLSEAKYVIIPEPLHKDSICVGHRGVWWAEIEIIGCASHSCMPQNGICAIRRMNEYMCLLEREVNARLENVSSSMPVVPSDTPAASLVFNAVQGGEFYEKSQEGIGFPAPLVASSCKLILERRFSHEETLDSVKQEILSILEDFKQKKGDFTYKYSTLFEFEPSFTDLDSNIVKATGRAIKDICRKEPKIVTSPGSYDQRHLPKELSKSCIAYGPGITALAHQADEYIEISALLQAAKVMALTVVNLSEVHA